MRADGSGVLARAGSSPDLEALASRLFRGHPRRYGESLPDGSVQTRWGALSPALLGEHLRGTRDLGCIPLRPDGTCYWAGVDLDRDDQGAAFRVRHELGVLGLWAWVFTSRARGYHVLSFFAEPVPAWAARHVLAVVLERAGLPRSTERFPKADAPGPKGAGNWLRLPYMGSAAPGRRVALGADGEPLALEEWLDQVELVPAARALAAAQALGAVAPDRRQTRLLLPSRRPGRLPALSDNPADLGLSPELAALVISGWHPGCRYRTRSELQQAVLVALSSLGHPDAVLWAALDHPKWGLRHRESPTGQRGGDYGRSITRARERAARPLSGWSGGVPTPAWRLLRGDAVALMVLADVGRHVNAGTGFALISLQGVARRIGYSTTTVKRAVARLKGHGLLEPRRLVQTWPTGRNQTAWRVLGGVCGSITSAP